ncbi:hypothetical protein BS78_08G073600 [Paspalum vaginatum]|nr:hypothetical protein BS78_08G073600 [Paspalum vaginatum]
MKSSGRCEQLKLVALYYEPPQLAGAAGKKGDTFQILKFVCRDRVLDVHPTQPLVLTAIMFRRYWCLDIFKCDPKDDTPKIENIAGYTTLSSRGSLLRCCLVADANPRVTSLKFIARKDYWFAVGDGGGGLRIYRYDTKRCINRLERAHSKSVDSLAVHPTKPTCCQHPRMAVLSCGTMRMA